MPHALTVSQAARLPVAFVARKLQSSALLVHARCRRCGWSGEEAAKTVWSALATEPASPLKASGHLFCPHRSASAGQRRRVRLRKQRRRRQRRARRGRGLGRGLVVGARLDSQPAGSHRCVRRLHERSRRCCARASSLNMGHSMHCASPRPALHVFDCTAASGPTTHSHALHPPPPAAGIWWTDSEAHKRDAAHFALGCGGKAFAGWALCSFLGLDSLGTVIAVGAPHLPPSSSCRTTQPRRRPNPRTRLRSRLRARLATRRHLRGPRHRPGR